MATAKDAHTLGTYYAKIYKAKYSKDPVFNRHAARWGFESVLMDMSINDAKLLLDYYLNTASTTQNRKHSLDWFLYNYEKLIESMQAQQEDAERRKKLREESEIRAREWRDSGKSGITSN